MTETPGPRLVGMGAAYFATANKGPAMTGEGGPPAPCAVIRGGGGCRATAVELNQRPPPQQTVANRSRSSNAVVKGDVEASDQRAMGPQ